MVLSEEGKKAFLDAEPLIGEVRGRWVWCKPCKKAIRLHGVRYSYQHWLAHRDRMHGKGAYPSSNNEPSRKRKTGLGRQKADAIVLDDSEDEDNSDPCSEPESDCMPLALKRNTILSA